MCIYNIYISVKLGALFFFLDFFLDKFLRYFFEKTVILIRIDKHESSI